MSEPIPTKTVKNPPTDVTDDNILLELKEAYKTMKQSEATSEYKRTKHLVEQGILLKKSNKTKI